MAKGEQKVANPISQAIEFFRDSTRELKKVHYPTKDETIQMTLRVFLMIIIFAVFLGFTDFAAGSIMRALIKL